MAAFLPSLVLAVLAVVSAYQGSAALAFILAIASVAAFPAT